MSTIRTVSLAAILAGLAGVPATAATCNLTVQGASILDDESCTVVPARRSTRIVVGSYGTIIVRGTAMSALVAGPHPSNGRMRRTSVPLGSVVMSGAADGKVCYFGQKAVLCVE